MKYCPLCGKEYDEGDTCTKDGAVLVRTAPDLSLKPGQMLKGSYRILEKIGQGGMAAVYRGVQLPLERDVAIKVLLPNMQAAPSMIQRFFQEAKVLCQMTHPNVVQIIDFGNTEDGLVYMVMEFLRGQTLAEMVPGKGLPTAQIQVLMRQICSGIGVAHESGLVHRDLKPENVFVTTSSHEPLQAKILDFGIARAISEGSNETRLTSTGLVMGTPGFLAPEQIGGASEADARSDLYALGAILYLMITGSRPYQGRTPSSILIQQLQEPPRLDLGRLAHRGLMADVVSKAMARNPDERFQTAGELISALESAIEKEGTEYISTVAIRKAVARGPEGAAASRAPSEGTDETLDTEISPAQIEAAGESPTAIPQPTAATLMVDELKAAAAEASEAETVLGGSAESGDTGGSAKWAWLGAGLIAAILIVGLVLPRGDRGDSQTDGSTDLANSVDVRGVDADRILVGMSAAFTGSAKELGRGMKLGIESCFREINDSGGIRGRELELVALDDGYEPSKTVANMAELLLERGAFAILGNVGTPTAEVAVPLALEQEAPFFGAFTGADLLRKTPPDPYVFNYRASYAEETSALVKYFLDVRGLEPAEIAVFAQEDGFGDAGYRGVVRTLEERGHGERVPRLGYRRNRIEVDGAVETLLRDHSQVKALVLVATYRAAAELIRQLEDRGADLLYANLSFVGSRALAEELGELGPGYAEGVIVSQVVPHYGSEEPGVVRYRQALAAHSPADPPGFVSLEGYLACRVFAEGLERAGDQPTVERFLSAVESMKDVDLGIGAEIHFGADRHQGSDRVWGTVLDASAEYRMLELEP